MNLFHEYVRYETRRQFFSRGLERRQLGRAGVAAGREGLARRGQAAAEAERHADRRPALAGRCTSRPRPST